MDEYLSRLAAVFDGVYRVLRDDGLLCVNIGDTFASGGGPSHNGNKGNAARDDVNRHAANTGLAPGNLLGVPWRLALLLQSRGWVWRDTVVWHKPSPMPAPLAGWRWQRCRVKVRPGWTKETHPSNTGVNGSQAHGDEITDDANRAQWAGCPGCPKCADNDGLVLRKGSWRPTPAWEPVFLFAKQMGYFACGEGVRTKAAASTLARDQYSRVLDDPDECYAVAHDHETPTNPAGANLRNVWTIAAESLDEPHYAAFPASLPRQVLRFACSERGVCRGCGAPWARVLDAPAIGCTKHRRDDHDRSLTGVCRLRPTAEVAEALAQYKTLGWRPTCTCPDPSPVGSVVLDPFCGSGRTGIAARQLGLRFVGIDLSEAYCQLARRQIGRALRKTKRVKKDSAPSLFDHAGEGTP